MRHPQDQPLAPFFTWGIEEGFLLLWFSGMLPVQRLTVWIRLVSEPVVWAGIQALTAAAGGYVSHLKFT